MQDRLLWETSGPAVVEGNPHEYMGDIRLWRLAMKNGVIYRSFYTIGAVENQHGDRNRLLRVSIRVAVVLFLLVRFLFVFFVFIVIVRLISETGIRHRRVSWICSAEAWKHPGHCNHGKGAA